MFFIKFLKNLKDHPHILKVYEYYQDKNDFYIISELCSGGELFERIVKAGSFSEKKASKVLNQILQAIKYVHNHKIIHRDLKPENILYESDDEDSPLKIIDFGTSVIYNPNKKMEENVGTVLP